MQWSIGNGYHVVISPYFKTVLVKHPVEYCIREISDLVTKGHLFYGATIRRISKPPVVKILKYMMPPIVQMLTSSVLIYRLNNLALFRNAQQLMFKAQQLKHLNLTINVFRFFPQLVPCFLIFLTVQNMNDKIHNFYLYGQKWFGFSENLHQLFFSKS